MFTARYKKDLMWYQLVGSRCFSFTAPPEAHSMPLQNSEKPSPEWMRVVLMMLYQVSVVVVRQDGLMQLLRLQAKHDKRSARRSTQTWIQRLSRSRSLFPGRGHFFRQAQKVVELRPVSNGPKFIGKRFETTNAISTMLFNIILQCFLSTLRLRPLATSLSLK